MAIGSIIGAAAGGSTSMITSGGSAFANKKAQEREQEYNQGQAGVDRQFAHDEAVLNRQFQQGMRDTAYQAASTDMEKAGLNKSMMYGGGKGPIASGSGAMASAQGARTQALRHDIKDPSQSIQAGMASALGLKKQKAEIGVLKEQAQKLKRDGQPYQKYKQMLMDASDDVKTQGTSGKNQSWLDTQLLNLKNWMSNNKVDSNRRAKARSGTSRLADPEYKTFKKGK